MRCNGDHTAKGRAPSAGKAGGLRTCERADRRLGGARTSATRSGDALCRPVVERLVPGIVVMQRQW
jgi:hypothetical protein